MALSKRERQISVVVLVAAGLFVADRVALTPYLERRRALTEEAAAKADELAGMARTIKEEGKIRRSLIAMAGADGARPGDASEAEGRFLTLLHDWERQAGVAKASFQRLQSAEAYGFTRLTFQVSAAGRMPAIAGLMYRIETAAIPLRIDQMQIMLSGESGEELQVQFKVSTLCRTAAGGGGGRPDVAPRRGGGLAVIDDRGGRR